MKAKLVEAAKCSRKNIFYRLNIKYFFPRYENDEAPKIV